MQWQMVVARCIGPMWHMCIINVSVIIVVASNTVVALSVIIIITIAITIIATIDIVLGEHVKGTLGPGPGACVKATTGCRAASCRTKGTLGPGPGLV